MEFWDAVANVGFPMAVTGYLLVRFETKIDKLTDAINSLVKK